jgi:hypothetical protein
MCQSVVRIVLELNPFGRRCVDLVVPTPIRHKKGPLVVWS